MSVELRPFEIIAALAEEQRGRSDQQILDALTALPPLADEDDACWDDSSYWTRVAYPYVALGDVARERRLRAAVRPLLDRACYGDPGEIMRGLRHVLEAIMQPDWSALADICIAAAASERRGTTLWAVEQLRVLDDERARPRLQTLAQSEHEPIRSAAEVALRRLDSRRTRED